MYYVENYKKVIFFALLTTFGCVSVASQSTSNRVHYFEFEKGAERFLIAPSAHEIVDLAFPKKFGYEITSKIAKSSGVCFEADSQKARKELVENPNVSKLLVDENNSASKYLESAEIRDTLIQQLKLNSETADRYLKQLTPFKFQAEVIANSVDSEFKNGKSALDLFFLNVANNLSVPVDYLESPEESAQQVIDTFENIAGWRKSFVELAKFVKCESCKIDQQFHGREFLKQVFYEGDLVKAKFHFDLYMKLTGENYPLGEAIGDKRTLYLAEKVIRKSTAKKCDLFLIGGSHFFGENSIQRLMEDQGYSVKSYWIDQ